MAKRSVSLVRTGSTGPRTLAGKAKSKFNALKHGVLSSAVVLDSESEQEYARFVSELANVLGPVGKLEETLVEKIASTIWRHRRLLQAEAAEIGREILVSEESFAQQDSKASMAAAMWGSQGLVRKALLSNDVADLFKATHLLRGLRQGILNHGLDLDRDRVNLKHLYGTDPEERASVESRESDPSIPTLYVRRFRACEGKNKDARSEDAESIAEVLTQLIDFLQAQAIASFSQEKKLDTFRTAANLIPNEKDCERLMRYEAHLDRMLERALSQLERLQRMRLGQPVPPPLKVEVSR